MTRLLKTSIVACWTSLFCISAFADDIEIYGGTWVEKGYAINGNWKIVERGDSKFVIFGEDFKTKKGPDLKIYLSKTSIEEIEGSTVSQSSLKLVPLQSHKGAQEYEIPMDVNVEDYSSLLIHCEEYAHLWGGGALER